MAVNPMQRKANNSFLLGILITLLITGLIIAFLLMQMSKKNEEIKALQQAKTYAYVLNRAVKSGEIITADDLSMKEVNKLAIPLNAITTTEEFEIYNLEDSQGRAMSIAIDEKTNAQKIMLSLSENEKVELQFEVASGKYYYFRENNGVSAKVYVSLKETTCIAKIDMEMNTLVTTAMITKGELLAKDVRKQEYNIITLPSQVATGDYVDIRLRLPNGQDYIVLSHKKIEIPTIEGTDSEKIIWLELSEVEILNVSSAIVESYMIEGSKLYATKYVEAGTQGAASVTYLPSDEVILLMERDPNAVQTAKNALFARNNNKDEKAIIRNPINNAKNSDEAQDNVKSKTQEEIQSLQEERQKYLESLSGESY